MHPLAIFSVVGFAFVGDGHRKVRGFKGGKAPLWGQGATPLQEGNSSAFPCHAEGWHRGSRYDIAILLPLPPWLWSVEKVRRKASRFPLHFAALVGWISWLCLALHSWCAIPPIFLSPWPCLHHGHTVLVKEKRAVVVEQLYKHLFFWYTCTLFLSKGLKNGT
jgi:hypothetical protein